MDILPATEAGPSSPSYTMDLTLPGGAWKILAAPAGADICLTNTEGLQGVDIYCLPPSAVDPATAAELTETADTLAVAVQHIPALGTELARMAPSSGPLDITGWDAFATETVSGASIRLRLQDHAVCVLISRASVMAPAGHDTATDIGIRMVHSSHDPEIARQRLPSPLAPVKTDIHIPPASARAYTVKAGEYIQVIDVQGRQCSDFLAFDATALAEGKLHGLDASVTRTLTGLANPGPGLYSRYFDDRMKPLVEIVQDTVGRHDTFLLACSARYYETQGYPGHTNCTDNFNNALSAYGVEAHTTWPAINFFFNTSVGHDGSIGLDEPWSRPGDYVLLRALTDLVCASSACPDDIDPANGWTPTDIHIRIYEASHDFPKGNGHRVLPASEARMTRETGFHPRTAPLAQHLQDYQGFWLAKKYTDTGAIEEYWACREKAALFDLSPLRKFEITGPDAEALLNYACTRDIRKLSIGQVVYTALCHPHGGMVDDSTVFRMGQHNFRFICGNEWCGTWLRAVASEQNFKAWVRSSTDQLHNVSLQGPLSRQILKDLFTPYTGHPSVEPLKWFHFTVGTLGQAEKIPVFISRTGYTGELGYEIMCHPQNAVAVWDVVMAAGKPYGLKPAGLDALNMLRIEAGLAFAGHEFCDQTDPIEAGIGFVVSAKKESDYIGKEALAKRAAGYRNKLIGLIVDGNDTVHHGDGLYSGRAQVGIVTSPTFSPLLGTQIALARVDPSLSEVGTSIEIGKLDGLQKRIPARVVPFPHYDPQKTRVRA